MGSPDAVKGGFGLLQIRGWHAGGLTLSGTPQDEAKDDMLLHDWQCMIIGPQQTHIGEFMYSVSIYVPDEWPAVRLPFLV